MTRMFNSNVEIRIAGSSGRPHLRVRSIGKSEDGFHLREIRPHGGFQLRNPNPDFLDFSFCRSIGKSEKGFAKLFS